MKVLFVVVDKIQKKTVYIQQEVYKDEDAAEIGIHMKQLWKKYRDSYVMVKLV